MVSQNAPQSPAEWPGFLLWRAANRWQQAQRRVLAAYDLTPVQLLLLTGLLNLGARDKKSVVKQIVLADHCRTDPMMTSQVVRALAEVGLVTRKKHKEDARAFAIALTGRGQTVAERAGKEMQAADAAFFALLAGDAGPFSDAMRILVGERPRLRVRAGRGEV